MYMFALVRLEDETGISGTGIVAYGIVFPSGKVSLEWHQQTGLFNWDSLEAMLDIHGHKGKTIVEPLAYAIQPVYFHEGG
jgi:hypothetical protein